MSELEFDLMMAAAEIADYQLSNESIHATAFFHPSTIPVLLKGNEAAMLAVVQGRDGDSKLRGTS